MNESFGIGHLQDLLLYRELKAEYEEILRHKWFESERAGHDVGFNKAMFDWKLKHSCPWWRERRVKVLSVRI